MKNRLKPRIYTFETTTRWTQNRKGILSSGDKRSIENAYNQCLISKALNIKIIIKPEIKCDE